MDRRDRETGTSPASAGTFILGQGGTLSGGDYDGFLYSGGNYTKVDHPGIVSTVAYEINASGHLVGYYTDNSGIHYGFIDTCGVYTTICPPSGNYTIANSINYSGQNSRYYGGGYVNGFVENGGVVTIDPPGSTNALVGGVNDLGQIVRGDGPAGHISQGFLAVPVTSYSNYAAQLQQQRRGEPISGLVVNSAGDLFGTTNGGDSGSAVFELVNNDDDTYTPVTLFSFDGTDGSSPEGTLISDAAGDLFGTTYGGGTGNGGTAFELVNDDGSYTLKTLINFSGPNGSGPIAGLTVDAAGDFFGTTYGGGTGSGTVFEIADSGFIVAAYTWIVAAYTWIGGTGDWDIASNWSLAAPPARRRRPTARPSTQPGLPTPSRSIARTSPRR